MYKFIAILVFVGILYACNSTAATTKNNKEKMELQNQEVDYNGQKIWVGEITTSQFDSPNYAWYQEEKDIYQIQPQIINEFKKDLQNFDIEIFMGTWCGDSHRETPAFFKILEAANYPMNQVKMFAVDRSKSTPQGFENGKNIDYVPTFIFYKNGQELGRIVESPINTLEDDIRDIVNGNPQIPNYAE